MKGFFWFSGDFSDWPLAIIGKINERLPGSTFSGMVNAPPYIMDRVKRWQTPVIEPVFDFSMLEPEWLQRPYQTGKLSAYEERLGPDSINRIIVADRMVGNGFVTGGVIPETPLMDMCRDHEMRLRYISGLLDFFFEQFEANRPDFVFTVGIAGAIALSLATVCKHLQIPVLRLTPTRIGSRHLIDDSPQGLAAPVERLLARARKDPTLVENLMEEARGILAEFRARPERPEYTQLSWRRSQSLPPMIDIAALAWRSLRRRPPEALPYPYPFAQLKWVLGCYLRARRLARSSVFRPSTDLDGHRYAYFPLHVDPESSTMVHAPLFTNQLAVVEALAKCLPAEFRLAVKEHVPMLGKRPRDYYARLAALPKVVLLSPFEDGFEIMKSSALTCVITGTAGWESVLMGRPTLCLGPALYHMLDQGFVVCSDWSDLTDAIRRALSTPPAEDERLALYLASMLEESFELPAGILWGNVTKKVIEDNVHIAEQIAARIIRLIEARNPEMHQPLEAGIPGAK